MKAEKQKVLNQVSLLQKKLENKLEENKELQEELQLAHQKLNAREEVMSRTVRDVENLKKEFFGKEQEYKNIINQAEKDKLEYNKNVANLKEDFLTKEQDYERIIMEVEGNLKEKIEETLRLQQIVSNLNTKLEVISFYRIHKRKFLFSFSVNWIIKH